MRATTFSAFLDQNGTLDRKQFWARLGYLTPAIFGLLLVDEIALALIIIHYQIQSLSVWLAVLLVPELPAIWYLFLIFNRRGNDVGIPSFFAIIATLFWILFSLAPLLFGISNSFIKEDTLIHIFAFSCAVSFPACVLIYGLLPGKIGTGGTGALAKKSNRRPGAKLDRKTARLHNA
jgi:uncharacterized membrane protein YhaH (DUF805 family)